MPEPRQDNQGDKPVTAKSNPKDPSVTMTIRLPQSVKEALTEEAWTRRMTPNKYAAQILRNASRLLEKDSGQPIARQEFDSTMVPSHDMEAMPERVGSHPLADLTGTDRVPQRPVARVLEPNGEVREFDPLTGRLAPSAGEVLRARQSERAKVRPAKTEANPVPKKGGKR
jgi:hypothetical protein